MKRQETAPRSSQGGLAASENYPGQAAIIIQFGNKSVTLGPSRWSVRGLREQAAIIAGIDPVVWEHLVDVAHAEVFLGQLGKHVAVVGGQHEVATFEQLLAGETRPLAIDFSATN